MANETVGFIGLGAMGNGMAKALVKAGFQVNAFDAYSPALAAGVAAGMNACDSPEALAATGIKTLVLMVVSGTQAEEVLWGESGAATKLQKGAVVILCSTVSPSTAKSLDAKLRKDGLLFVDAPVSGGTVKAAEGTLTIFASGSPSAMAAAEPALNAMSGLLYKVGSTAGEGTSVKTVNQLLAGVHIAAAAEAMAFGARAGLDTRQLYEIITNAAGNSWMFENRVPRMLDEAYSPAKSQLNIFVKDLAIVLGEARDLTFPCPLAAAAHQQFLAGSAAGWGKLDDSSLVKVFEQATGVRVACPELQPGQRRRWPSLSLSETLADLPPVHAREGPLEEIRGLTRSGGAPKLVVLDDDPTGTQTVRRIAVLTEWSVESLKTELTAAAPGFFILTNSRALPTQEARRLTQEICANVNAAAKASGVACTVVLRGDSCLRGHYPAEVDAAAKEFGGFDATVICPFFLQGGRYTINDVHYVAAGDVLTPVSETEFAKDKAFGFRESNVCDWIEEKSEGRVKSTDVQSLTIHDLRVGGVNAVTSRLLDTPRGGTIVVNAAAEADLSVFCAGLLHAEAAGRKFLCRTAASFVSARLGIDSLSAPLVAPAQLELSSKAGGLIMVGSYVQKSTAQVEVLKAKRGDKLEVIEVPVSDILVPGGGPEQAAVVAKKADKALQDGQDVLVLTSRTLVHGKDANESLDIGSKVSDCLVQALQAITTRPRYLLAKGGITSSDLATKGLNVSRALVAGQAAPGVSTWLLGAGSRWEGLPYIVFPGNVGTDDTVATVVEAWAARVEQRGWWE